MRALLDTHTFLWWIDNDRRLSMRVRTLMGDGSNVLFFSAASGWEIAIKARLGKLQLPGDLAPFLTDHLVRNHVTILSIHLSHTLHVYTLPTLHRDPFDRERRDPGPLCAEVPLVVASDVRRTREDDRCPQLQDSATSGTLVERGHVVTRHTACGELATCTQGGLAMDAVASPTTFRLTPRPISTKRWPRSSRPQRGGCSGPCSSCPRGPAKPSSSPCWCSGVAAAPSSWPTGMS